MCEPPGQIWQEISWNSSTMTSTLSMFRSILSCNLLNPVSLCFHSLYPSTEGWPKTAAPPHFWVPKLKKALKDLTEEVEKKEGSDCGSDSEDKRKHHGASCEGWALTHNCPWKGFSIDCGFCQLQKQLANQRCVGRLKEQRHHLSTKLKLMKCGHNRTVLDTTNLSAS